MNTGTRTATLLVRGICSALTPIALLVVLDLLLSSSGAAGRVAGPQPRVSGDVRLVYVDGSNGGIADGSRHHPWPTIGQGLAAANAGDEVLVAEGIYTESLVITGSLALAGGFASYTSPISWTRDSALHVTIIDGGGLGTVISVTRQTAAATDPVRISGFRITGGQARLGGGLYAAGAALILEDDLFVENHVTGSAPFGAGGGIYVQDAALAITDTQVLSNTASQWGGGIYALDTKLVMSSTQVVSNSAGQGGGGMAVLHGPAAVLSSTIASNRADWWGGGGIYVNGSPATIEDTQVLSNSALCCGGGISVLGARLSLEHSRVDHNRVDPASYYGGGIYASDSDAALDGNLITANSAQLAAGLLAITGRYTMTNNYIAHNVGGGIVIQAGEIRNNTLRENGPNQFGEYACAICLSPPPSGPSFVTITNNIVISSAFGIASSSDAIVVHLSHNDVWHHSSASYSGLTASPDDIAADPLLDDDYGLLAGSPCIDAGSNEGAPPADIESDFRPMDGDADGVALADIGADEYPGQIIPTPTPTRIYLPLIVQQAAF